MNGELYFCYDVIVLIIKSLFFNEILRVSMTWNDMMIDNKRKVNNEDDRVYFFSLTRTILISIIYTKSSIGRSVGRQKKKTVKIKQEKAIVCVRVFSTKMEILVEKQSQ